MAKAWNWSNSMLLGQTLAIQFNVTSQLLEDKIWQNKVKRNKSLEVNNMEKKITN